MSLLHQLWKYEQRMRDEGKKAAQDAGRASGGEMPFMYALQNVRYEVRLNGDGTVRDVVPHTSGKTKGKDLGKPIPAPNLVRSATKAKLLMDNGEYTLGLPKKANDPKTAERHIAFKKLLDICAEATGERSVRVIADYLRGHQPEAFREQHLSEFPDFAADLNVMFTVDGVNPLELREVRKFWAAQFAQDEKGDGLRAECLITGEFGPVMDMEPVKIKGILGGQTAGMNFISANAQAFESYGLERSNIAPVKFEVAEQYANGLNRLLGNPDTSLKIGGVTYAFWTGEGAVPLVGEALREPPALNTRFKAQVRRDKKWRTEEVRQTLWGVFQGKQTNLLRGAAFYAVGLTPSGSRIAVRTHLNSTVQDAVDNLADFFEAQILAPVHPEGSKYPDPETYDLRMLVSSMYRDISKENPAQEVDALVQFALAGQALPPSFLPKLAARNRAEKRVTRPRAVLTKMVLLSRDWKELNMDKDSLDALNPHQPEPAYHLGRLLAVLDDIQSSVMKANTTLVDRFYGSMSTTPYAVVGRLIHGSQAHLQKLRKDKPGVYKLKQDDLEDVMSRLKDIPAKPLTTAQQALFALGYYHQRAHISEGIREGKAAKEAKAGQTAEAQPPLLFPEGDDAK